ncbi:TolC family outer membrane protein [Silicimonas sp. MF1-12-2]|uniref:TolC family outer membrane protein n=1 Tax=Silicimonas sp. MF1-12-2 TaxID=3384793 RepID=UPI0039B659E5
MRCFGKKAATLAIALFASAGPGVSETLTDALVTSYRNSGLIAQNRAVLRAADEDVAQAVATLRPAISYALGVNYSDPSQGDDLTGSLSVTANMLLYDFGRSQLGVDAAKETVLATRAALIDVENTVLLNTVIAYMSVRRSEAFVNLRENNVRLLNEQLRATRDRFDVGEVTRTDVSLAEARLAAARSGLAAEQGGLARAREQYKAVVGQYPGTLAAPPSPPSIPSTEEAAREVARKENPQIRQVQHQVKATELVAERAARGVYPSLNASGRVGIDDDGDDSLSLGLDLTGPLYQGGAITSTVRKAQAQKDQVRAQLYTTGLLVDQQVGNAYANLAVATASIDASDRQVRAAQLALEGVREELQLGARTTLEVLDQEQELLDAQTNRVAAQVDRYLAVYEVLDSMGLLTAERLGLNVPIYDPAAYYNAVKDAPGHLVSPEGRKLDRVLRAIGKE